MKQNTHPYQTLAMIMQYPAKGYKRTFSHDLGTLDEHYPEEMQALSPFTDYVQTHNETELQELYTRTFDVHAVCYLDIGYVLFGEDYKRGQFLVHMNREHALVDNDCGTELPDHLPNILNLLSKLEKPDFALEFTQTFLMPALEKMLNGFKDGGNPYSAPLNAILSVIKKDYGDPVQQNALQGVPS